MENDGAEEAIRQAIKKVVWWNLACVQQQAMYREVYVSVMSVM